ncbi:ABC transporter permease subunit [Anaerolineales bacterium HSG24]|nr:ABC transporter permease subunit [Anaerolineales bacterium HSG24]
MTSHTNPIIVNEMRTRMRGCRAYVLLTLYLALISCITATMYVTIYDTSTGLYGDYDITTANVRDAPDIGKAIFISTTILLLFLITHIAPAFTAASISGEREKQTYDILITTPLLARRIVWGKLGAVFLFLFLLILTSLPVQSLAFLFGGVAFTELIIATLVLAMSALAFGSVGLYISSLNRTTMVSILFTYSVILPFVYGLPFIVFWLGTFTLPVVALIGSVYSELASMIIGIVMAYLAGFLLSLNPFSSGLLTIIAATNGNGYFFFTEQVFYNISIPMVSPWIIYVFFCVFIVIVMAQLTIRQLNQISNF